MIEGMSLSTNQLLMLSFLHNRWFGWALHHEAPTSSNSFLPHRWRAQTGHGGVTG
jgi:hypothetical protein